MEKVTLNEIIEAVRELTFDRFIIPAFAIKEEAGNSVSITEEALTIWKNEEIIEGGTVKPKEKIFEAPFEETANLQALMEKFIEDDIVVAYTPYFRGTEACSTLLKTKKDLDIDFTAFRKYFFSDKDIIEMIRCYYWKVLGNPIGTIEITDETIGLLKRPSEQHMAIWVSYYLVDRRRMYEAAAESLGQSFTDGSDYSGTGAASTPGSTTVQIGSVFTLTESAEEGYFQEDFNGVGSDNVWGDRYSFWYRLMLYLRGLLEECFGDYSLRKTQVIQGEINLIRDQDFRSYYDSYPFTLSPLTRGIVTRRP